MKDQFKGALTIQRDGSKQILATMVSHSEATNNSLKHQIVMYQKVVNLLDECVKTFGDKNHD